MLIDIGHVHTHGGMPGLNTCLCTCLYRLYTFPLHLSFFHARLIAACLGTCLHTSIRMSTHVYAHVHIVSNCMMLEERFGHIPPSLEGRARKRRFFCGPVAATRPPGRTDRTMRRATPILNGEHTDGDVRVARGPQARSRWIAAGLDAVRGPVHRCLSRIVIVEAHVVYVRQAGRRRDGPA